ncbi:hypothetical protein M0804_007246 [Polistes exclamans]|nr:hypothetical protein M0804_007246 [Polistes exclamans]
MNSQRNRDFELALNLHDELNIVGVTENAIIPDDQKKKSYKPKTLVDETLEIIDPTPNIYTLFMQFNTRFFWNVLLPVEVKWSNRMTSCAGICSYHSRNKQCIISLSVPLLKLRPRKDLVETLLHEMIHGYLFLTNNNRDRDGHGPEFCKHMHRINKEAGTNITIYHTFHDEVKLYQQHWWRCDGPCHKKAPYFGTVRRAMNRAPGPSDFWWREHQQSCGGKFIKIKEPENFKTKNTMNNPKLKAITKNTQKENSITDWLINNDNSSKQHKSNNISTSQITPISKIFKSGNNKNKNMPKSVGSPLNAKINNKLLDDTPKKLGNNMNNIHGWDVGGPKNSSTSKVVKKNPIPKSSDPRQLGGILKKLGNNTNNIHGWGVGGPNSSSVPKVVNKNYTPKFSCSGQIGGSNTGKSNLLNKFCIKNNNEQQILSSKNTSSYGSTNTPSYGSTNNTVLKSVQENTSNNTLNQNANDSVNCPVCNVTVSVNIINDHVDSCLENEDEQKSYNIKDTPPYSDVNSQMDTSPIKDTIFTTPKRSNVMRKSSTKRQKVENSHESESTDCPICHKRFKTTDIYNHFDVCFPEQCSSNSSDNIIVIDSSSDCESPNSIFIDDSPDIKLNKKPNIMHENHKCLICNTIIPFTMSLNDHLEECIGTMFNDESISFSDNDNDNSNSEDARATDRSYPCPVCMELFTENIMNEHLDTCLKKY